MSARIIDRYGNVEEMTEREFFTRVFGHPPRTPEQKAAEWRADCERYADWIETGDDWAVPPPMLAEARRIAAERSLGEPLSELKRTGTGGWL